MPRPFQGDECKGCSRARTRERPLSRRGFCAECSTKRQTDAVRQLADHKGPIFDRWRERTAGSVGGGAAPASRRELTGGTDST